MSSVDRFPIRLADIEACPERFRGPLRNTVDRSEAVNTNRSKDPKTISDLVFQISELLPGLSASGQPAFGLVLLANRIWPFSPRTCCSRSYSSDRPSSGDHCRRKVRVLVRPEG
jgi:hypothetical protein